MNLLRPALARAYVNHGRWVADCPQPYCYNAEPLQPGQWMFQCTDTACLVMSEVEWPSPMEAHNIWKALLERPNPANRNWFPAGHPLAEAAGKPHGLTAAQLAQETTENLARIAAEHETVRIAAEHEQRAAAHSSEVRAAIRERNERWADEGHEQGGPLFHPGSDENGFPPEHTITRGPKGGAK